MVSKWAPQVGETVDLDSWSECLNHLLSSGGEGALYRGHRIFEWKLQCSLERALEEHAKRWNADTQLVMQSMIDDVAFKQRTFDVESALTQQFRHRATRLDYPNLPPAWDTLGWWELMQHNGAPTRLLDWTSSPFIAMWFAVYDHKDGDGDMALWVYDRHVARMNLVGLMAKLKEANDYDQIDDRQLQNRLVKLTLEREFDLPVPVTPRQFPRAVAQQSVLTVIPNIAVALSASEYVRRRLATCVRLKEEWKPSIKDTCRSMGLSRFSLFRDIDSLGSDVRQTFLNTAEIPEPF